MVCRLHHAIQKFSSLLRVKFASELKNNCSEIACEFGVIVNVEKAVELECQMGHKFDSQMSFGTGDEKTEVKLEQSNCKRSQPGLFRKKRMLENLTNIHFLECVLEESLFGRAIIAYADCSFYQTHQSIKALLSKSPTAEV